MRNFMIHHAKKSNALRIMLSWEKGLTDSNYYYISLALWERVNEHDTRYSNHTEDLQLWYLWMWNSMQKLFITFMTINKKNIFISNK